MKRQVGNNIFHLICRHIFQTISPIILLNTHPYYHEFLDSDSIIIFSPYILFHNYNNTSFSFSSIFRAIFSAFSGSRNKFLILLFFSVNLSNYVIDSSFFPECLNSATIPKSYSAQFVLQHHKHFFMILFNSNNLFLIRLLLSQRFIRRFHFYPVYQYSPSFQTSHLKQCF
jgi:hypothetical protein